MSQQYFLAVSHYQRYYDVNIVLYGGSNIVELPDQGLINLEEA